MSKNKKYIKISTDSAKPPGVEITLGLGENSSDSDDMNAEEEEEEEM